jgi:hypothetical protein
MPLYAPMFHVFLISTQRLTRLADPALVTQLVLPLLPAVPNSRFSTKPATSAGVDAGVRGNDGRFPKTSRYPPHRPSGCVYYVLIFLFLDSDVIYESAH